MKTKVSALASDILLVALIIGGAIWLFTVGLAASEWTTDRALLPLSVEGSRALILLTALGVVLGLLLAATIRQRRTRVVDGELVRYSLYDRLVHWGLALGYVLAFASGAWLLRWAGLDNSAEARPTLYLVHFIGAGLITLGAVTFVTRARVAGQDALFPRWRDLSPAIARLFGYLGVYGESGVLGLRMGKEAQAGWQRALAAIGIRPGVREGKFLAVEKVFSFAPLAILTFIVIFTGLIKSARYFFAVPIDVVAWATWLHGWTTWGTLIVVGLHLAAIFLVPRNWPGMRAMVSGRTPLKLAEHEFPAWADEVERAGPRRRPARWGASDGRSADGAALELHPPGLRDPREIRRAVDVREAAEVVGDLEHGDIVAPGEDLARTDVAGDPLERRPQLAAQQCRW
ncbi:MAG: cytochrome b/b6 domain-containing protein [Chloroflexi bacterium]|nr:cytochrome b/b6 domain-containing protein [Chloroflexota bacterium]